MLNKILLTLFLVLSVLSVRNIARATTLEDLGLTEEDTKYLTPAEKEEILNPKERSVQALADENAGGSLATVPSAASNFGEGVTSCFDYYTFGSVQADFSASVATVSSGSAINFSGKIVNNNPYPIVKGSFIVKIFKAESNREKNINGPDVIDEMVVIKDVSIAANGSIPLQFEWKVPSYALSGEYKAATFFVSADKFNLLGLSFTDDVIGNSAAFNVVGESQGVLFDKDSATINGNAYRFAAFPPRINKDSQVVVSADIINTTNQAHNIPVTWKVYAWDARSESNLITESEGVIAISAKGKAKASFTVEDKDHPVYYIVVEAGYKDTKSILGIRFVRDGVNQTRINFPSVTSFPIKKGVENTVFSCIHGMGTAAVVPNGHLVLALRSGGNVIHSYEYKGDITGSMMGVKDTFVPKKNYNNFTLSAELYQADKLVDSVEMSYSCKDIDPNTCTTESSQKMLLVFTLTLLVMIIVFFAITRKGSKVLAIAILLLGSAVLGLPQKTDAKEIQWNTTLGKFAYFWNFSDTQTAATTSDSRRWAPALDTPNITVTYGATITKVVDGVEEVVADGAILPVGTPIKLKFTAHAPEHISWFGTGYSGDSPYGEWRNNATPPSLACAAKDYVNRSFYERPRQKIGFVTIPAYSAVYDTYVPLVISPPVKEITNLNNLTCSALSGDVMDCTVSGEGAISPTFKFKETEGKMYYRWKRVSSTGDDAFGGDNCNGNNVPLRSVATFVDSLTRSYTDDSGATISGGVIMERMQNYVTGIGTTGYKLQVPEKTISFNVTGLDEPNNPPENPVITGPTEGVAGESYTFSFKSTDPDDDTVRYGIDWNGGQVVGTLVPSPNGSGPVYVPDETSQTASKSWNTAGTYTFKIKAEDNRGLSSIGWSEHQITISPAAPEVACVSPSVAVKNTSVTFNSSVSDGKAPFTYTWSGDVPANSRQASVSQSFSTIGIRTARVTVTDALGRSATSENCSIEIVETYAPPSNLAITTAPSCSETAGYGQTLVRFNADGTLPILFDIYRSSTATNNLGSYYKIGSFNKRALSDSPLVLDDYLPYGSTYYYKVVATNSAGNATSAYIRAINVAATDCNYIPPPNAACGPAVDYYMYSLPNQWTSGLCQGDNTANSIVYNASQNRYTWNCSVDGASQGCFAPRATDGNVGCGGAVLGHYTRPPSSNLCNPGTSAGASLDMDNPSKFKWTCTSADGANTATCRASKTDNPEGASCGSAASGLAHSIPTDNLCDEGELIGSVQSGIDQNGGFYSWECGEGGNVATCDVRKSRPPRCGEPGQNPCPRCGDPGMPACRCGTSGQPSCPPGETVRLGDLKIDPPIVNKDQYCSVDIGTDSGAILVSTPNTRCSIAYPNGDLDDDTKRYGGFVPPTTKTSFYEQRVRRESKFTLTCWEQDPVTAVKTAQVSAQATCKINPSYVETSFFKRMLVGVRDMTASVFDAFGRLFNLK